VVGDLARAEQMLRSLNGESVWSRVALYESDGRRLILDASPDNLKQSGAPRWVKHLVPVTLEEHRVAIAAPPVVYGVLAVTPSVQSLESDLWAEIRTMIAVTGVLLVTLLGLTHVILLVGLRPVRALAESAARLGSGDLTARMRETRLSEMAPTVRAFNSMAASLEQALHEARTREARLESLVEISGDLSRMQELDSLIGRIAEACGRLVNTDWVGFRLVDGDELAMAGTLESSDLMVTPSLKIGSGLAGTVAASGRPLLVRDPADDPRMLPEDAKEVRRFGARGFLGVPAKIGDRVVGVLTFQTKREEGFSAEDMAIATAFASHAAIAVENRRLLLESRRAYDELAETQGQLEQVQKMDAIGRLAGGVAHDFNNLLTVILGRADILLRQLKPEDSMHRGIELIQRTAGRAADLTRQLLAFGRKQVLEPVVLDLSAVTMDMKDMLDRRGHRAPDHADPGARPREGRPRADRAGDHEPVRQRARRHAPGRPPHPRDRERGARRRVRAPARRGAARASCHARRLRYRHRDPARDPGAYLRAVLHDQRAGQGHRTRPGHRLRHRQAERRACRGGQRAGQGHDVPDLPAPARRRGHHR